MSSLKTIEVVAAIIVQDGRVLVTQRGYGDGAGKWEFPGGKIEAGENPQQALQREIREELKVDIAVQEYLMTVEHDYPSFHLTMHCYMSRLLQGSPQLTEHIAMAWVEANDLPHVDWLPADWAIVQPLMDYLH